MKIILTIASIFLFIAASAQELTAVTVRSNSVDIMYDSTVVTKGVKIDTVITKSYTKWPGKQSVKSDTVVTRTNITKTDTFHFSKSFIKPVDMKLLFSAASIVIAVTINGQQFHASKYGFSWYFDTTASVPPAPGAITYGALWATWSGPQSIEATNTFSPFSEIRALAKFDNWNGYNSPITEQYLSASKKVLLNVHAFSQNASLPPGADTNKYSNINLATWRSNCNKLANSISRPEDVIFCSYNEEDNFNYSIIEDSTDLEPYVEQTSILSRAGAARGIKVANGGLQANQLVFATYRYLSDIGSADTVNFLAYCIPPQWQNAIKNRSSTTLETYITNVRYLLTRYDTIPAEFLTDISLHLYFPFTRHMNDTATNWSADYNGIDQIVAMVNHFCPGRELIITEMGFVINDSALTSTVITDIRSNNIKHVIYYNSPTMQDGIYPIATSPTVKTVLGNNFSEQIVE